jgi:hypothetical protein
MEVQATPVPAYVPNPQKTGPNWLPGIWMVWAEKSWDHPSKWIYCYTDRRGFNSVSQSDTGCFPSHFRTKGEALQAGIRYVKTTYKPVECPDAPFLAEPGPFQLVNA